jgi:hypothetical protein
MERFPTQIVAVLLLAYMPRVRHVGAPLENLNWHGRRALHKFQADTVRVPESPKADSMQISGVIRHVDLMLDHPDRESRCFRSAQTEKGTLLSADADSLPRIRFMSRKEYRNSLVRLPSYEVTKLMQVGPQYRLDSVKRFFG